MTIKNEPVLFLCGSGMKLMEITIETFDALRHCDVIFSDALDKDGIDFFRKQGLKFVDLSRAPSKRTQGQSIQNRIRRSKVAKIFAALAKGYRCGVVHAGHPTFLCGLTEEITREARKRSIPYRILNAVSSLDAVLTQAEFSVLETGMHVYDVSSYGRDRFIDAELDPRFPQIMLKVGYLAQKSAHGPRNFCRYLSRFYPPDHPAILFQCASKNPRDERLETTIRGLARKLSRMNVYSTLYLPAYTEKLTTPPRPVTLAA